MSGGALAWINTKMSATDELGIRPWVSWQAFEKALKAQFEPLSKEEQTREQTRKLVQTGHVNTYIYLFRELKNEIPSMNWVDVRAVVDDILQPKLRLPRLSYSQFSLS